MQFLRTLFWVVLAVIAAIFTFKNWTNVPISLWGGLQADVKLPVLVGIAFLLGLLPPLVLYRATRWRMRRRLDAAERQLAEYRGDLVASAGTAPAGAAAVPPPAVATTVDPLSAPAIERGARLPQPPAAS